MLIPGARRQKSVAKPADTEGRPALKLWLTGSDPSGGARWGGAVLVLKITKNGRKSQKTGQKSPKTGKNRKKRVKNREKREKMAGKQSLTLFRFQWNPAEPLERGGVLCEALWCGQGKKGARWYFLYTPGRATVSVEQRA